MLRTGGFTNPTSVKVDVDVGVTRVEFPFASSTIVVSSMLIANSNKTKTASMIAPLLFKQASPLLTSTHQPFCIKKRCTSLTPELAKRA
jgi:hypothetical protein